MTYGLFRICSCSSFHFSHGDNGLGVVVVVVVVIKGHGAGVVVVVIKGHGGGVVVVGSGLGSPFTGGGMGLGSPFTGCDWPYKQKLRIMTKGPIIYFFDGRTPSRHKGSFTNYVAIFLKFLTPPPPFVATFTL